jgi:hypothetical protein
MKAGRNVGMMGIAIGLSAAVAIGMVTGSDSLRASGRQDGQPPASSKPVVYKSLKHDLSPRLDSMQPIEPVAQDLNRVRINRFLPSRLKMAKQASRIWQDPVAQLAHGLAPMPSPIQNFAGVPNVSGVLPPDTQGDVGPNHYVQWVNLAFAVYDKTGTKVYPAGTGYANGNTLWSGFGGECETTNDGDPITLYDRAAGRWLMSQFAVSGVFTQCIAISQTGDPTGAWYRYAYAPFGNKMNDYPHFGIWPDGYYMTVNQFTNGVSWGGAGVVAFEREKMLSGLAAQAVYFDLYGLDPNLGGMLPSDTDGLTPPPVGSPNYVLQFDDDAWGYPADQLELWKFHVDWTTPSSSSFTGPTIINLTSLSLGFDANMCGGSRNCIPQPGTAQRLDAISDRLMYRLAYRNFGTHESLVFNHTVDENGADHAGIRWYELRAPNGTPTIYQAGTYAPDADHRWMGSIAMDRNGNIALGYSVSSATTYPSVRYVGRLSGDPLGTMAQSEVTLAAGSGSQTHSAARWGDYSMMGIDPIDDCTFWYTQEYLATTGSAPWLTRIGSFKFPSCGAADSGTVAGTVTDSGTGFAIQGAKVQLSALMETQTAADGTYQFSYVPIGTYDLTFSKLGYVSQTFNGLNVTTGATTTQNAALVSAAPATVSGVVRDGSGHAWPLYARIDVAGIPSKTVYTNPATGQYSISLWAGATYALTATALVPGYQTGAASATPTGTPAVATVNFDLAVNAAMCTAMGYAQTVPHSVDFEATDGGYVGAGVSSSWAWGTPTVVGPATAHSGTKVWATNLSGSYNNSETSTLTSPVIDLSAYAGLVPTVTWWQWLQTESGYDYASVQVSKDSGATWATIYGPLSGTIDGAWTRHAVAAPDATYAVPGFRFRFRLTTDSSVTYPGWYVDDVSVALGCNAVAGGMVVGAVTDANTTLPLVGATVTGVVRTQDRAITIATPNDPNQPDGFYQLFSGATGSVAFDATMTGGYGTQRVSVPVLADQTVTQNFQVPAGRLAALPTSLTAELMLGTTLTRQFTLTNSGGADATYQIKEIRTTAPETRPVDGANQAVAGLAPPLPPDKAYYDAPSARGLARRDQPVGPPLAAGDVIQSWSSGLAGPWGIAFDGASDTVWVSSPMVAWTGQNRLAEYSQAGVATGRNYGFTWNPVSGPADGAFNWNTGRIFVMNVQTGVANCIFEIDPATGPTGNKICPGGATGFAISQRGVAYDPVTDTWYAGSWNDQTIYHFSNSGTILDSKVVSLDIAGLAYNPDTRHLFVMPSASPTTVSVLDTSNDYNLVGQFSIAGFGDYAGVGLEIGCNGHLWANNANDGRTYEIDSGETTSMCSMDYPWLSAAPTGGTVTAGSSQVITVTFDARASAGITESGQYKASLAIQENTPYDVPSIPITMIVNSAPGAPTGLTGTVNGSTVTLSWTAPAGPVLASPSPSNPATGYVVEVGTAPGWTNLISFNTGTLATTFVANGIPTGQYYIRVRGSNIYGTGPASNEIRLIVGNVTPGAPSGLAGGAVGSMVSLTWVAPTTGGPPTAYQIEAGSSTGLSDLANFSTGNSLVAFSASGVANGRYYIRVRATNVAGASSASNEIVLIVGPTAPGPPSGLTWSSAGSSVALSWTAPSTGGAPTAYQIEAGSTIGAVNLANFSTLNTATSYATGGVGNGTYYVRVKASNAMGISWPSNEAVLVVGCTAAAGAPSALHTNSNSGGTVQFGWTAPSYVGTSNGPTSYVLEAGSAPGLSNLATVDLLGPATTATFSGISSGTYYVRVKAKNSCGTSSASNEFTLIVP